eukprot:EG_transcript_19094
MAAAVGPAEDALPLEVRLVTSLFAAEGPQAPEPAPFRDRAGFWRRLGTFAVGRWAVRGDGGSPVDCALHGWESAGPGALKCASCDAELHLQGIGKGDRFEDALRAKHHSCCRWAEGALCDPDFAKVDLTGLSLATTREQCRAMHHHLRTPVHLPEDWLGEVRPSAPDLETVLDAVLDNDMECEWETFSLVVAGWELDAAPGQLRCNWCQHAVPLRQVDRTTSTPRFDLPAGFHPKQDHRFFCPFLVERQYRLPATPARHYPIPWDAPLVTASGTVVVVKRLLQLVELQRQQALKPKAKRLATRPKTPDYVALAGKIPDWAAAWVLHGLPGDVGDG